jgi:Fibronectin type III domain
MNTKGVFSWWCAPLLLLLSTLLTGILMAQNPLPNRAGKVVDLGWNAGHTALLDNVTGRSYASGESINGAPPSTFQNADGAIQPESINLPSWDPTVQMGFTVAVQIASVAQPKVGTVFTLVDGRNTANSLLFAVLHDVHGRWWIGKRRDAPEGTTSFIWYAEKTWDPVSPCIAPLACSTDTIYVSFQSNGQIQLDEVATLNSKSNPNVPDRYDWESGLLNFGLPQQGYNDPTFALDTAPVALPQITAIGGIQLTSLPSALFSSPAILGESSYPAALIARLAVWANNSGQPGIGILGNAGILADQAFINGTVLVPQSNWLPCTSGQFEQPRGYAETLSRQYDPSQLPTPCNVPSAPQDVTYSLSGDSAVINFSAPEFLGTGLPGQTPAITGYSTASNPPVAAQCSIMGPGGSCNVTGLQPNTTYTFAISAKGVGGSTETLTGWGPGAYIHIQPQALNPPTDLVITTGPGSLSAKWQGPTNGAPVTGYTVELYDNNQPVASKIVDADTTSVTFYNLTPHGLYAVWVISNGAQGDRSSPLRSTGQARPNLTVWKICANENGSCETSAGDPVFYGTTLRVYSATSYSGRISCTNQAFGGDPLPTVGKTCFTTPARTVPIGPPGYTFCAYEGGTCFAPPNSTFAFGVKDRFEYKSYTDNKPITMACDFSVFPDPAPGYSKSCFVRLAASTVITNVRFSQGDGYLILRWDGNLPSYQVTLYDEGFKIGTKEATGNSSAWYNLIPYAKYTFIITPWNGGPGVISFSVSPRHVEWDRCARQNESCDASGAPFLIRYSYTYWYGPEWRQPSYAGNITDRQFHVPCNDLVFGDPLSGVNKACWSAPMYKLPLPPNGKFVYGGWTFCGYQGDTCYIPGAAAVTLGLEGFGWTEKNVSSATSIPCTLSEFGTDPVPGAVKSCFYLFKPPIPGVVQNLQLKVIPIPDDYSVDAIGSFQRPANISGLLISLRYNIDLRNSGPGEGVTLDVPGYYTGPYTVTLPLPYPYSMTAYGYNSTGAGPKATVTVRCCSSQ